MRGLIIFLCIFTTITLKTNSQYLLPIIKDEPANQFFTVLEIGASTKSPIHLLLDLGTDLTWLNCLKLKSSSSLRDLPCHSSTCKSVPNNVCDNDEGKSCLTSQQNPFEICRVVQDTASILTGDGSSLVPFRPFTFSCSAEETLHGLAPTLDGVLSLSPSNLSLTKQVTSAFNLTPKFALCLPSSSSDGSGRFYISDMILPFNQIPLTLTPIRGIDSGTYLIDVHSINVDETLLSLNPNLLTGGAKLSTVVPYTILHTDIYNALAESFTLKALEMGISPVSPVAPFEVCFDASSVGNKSTGPNVPDIAFTVPSLPGSIFDVMWRFHGANTMVKVNQTVMCLAFIDGGKKQEGYSMIIGTHQIQDYLLEFDFNQRVLGFSESLLLYNATCSHI